MGRGKRNKTLKTSFKANVIIENKIGRIFKRHNIIEYKSPNDSEGVNEYFKAQAYASLYKIGKDGKSYDPEDITITMNWI